MVGSQQYINWEGPSSFAKEGTSGQDLSDPNIARRAPHITPKQACEVGTYQPYGAKCRLVGKR